MLTISVWPRRLKEFLLTHPLYKSPSSAWLVSSAGTIRFFIIRDLPMLTT